MYKHEFMFLTLGTNLLQFNEHFSALYTIVELTYLMTN